MFLLNKEKVSHTKWNLTSYLPIIIFQVYFQKYKA